MNRSNDFTTNDNGLGNIELNIAGFALKSNKPLYKNDKLYLGSSSLTTPKYWGDDTISLNTSPTISDEGLIFAPSVGLPDIVDLTGFGFKLSAELRLGANGYEFGAEGYLHGRNIKGFGFKNALKDQGQCFIRVGVTLWYDPATRAMMMDVRPSNAPVPTTRLSTNDALSAPNNRSFGLSRLILGMKCDPGYPIMAPIFLTYVQGEGILRRDTNKLNLQIQLATSTIPPLIGPALKLDGEAEMSSNPELYIQTKGILSFFFLKMAENLTTFSESRGLESQGTFFFLRGLGRVDITLRAWGKNDKLHLAGSGRAQLGVAKGNIFRGEAPIPCAIKTKNIRLCIPWTNTCASLPIISGANVIEKTCTYRFKNFIKDINVPYICGVVDPTKICTRYMDIPSDDLILGNLGAKIGEFRGDQWGFKGFGTWNKITRGFFVNSKTGKVDWGNVDQYVLVK